MHDALLQRRAADIAYPRPIADSDEVVRTRASRQACHALRQACSRRRQAEDPASSASQSARRRFDQRLRTLCRSNAERLMTLSTSAVAICCSSDSLEFRCAPAPRRRAARSRSRSPPDRRRSGRDRCLFPVKELRRRPRHRKDADQVALPQQRNGEDSAKITRLGDIPSWCSQGRRGHRVYALLFVPRRPGRQPIRARQPVDWHPCIAEIQADSRRAPRSEKHRRMGGGFRPCRHGRGGQRIRPAYQARSEGRKPSG